MNPVDAVGVQVVGEPRGAADPGHEHELLLRDAQPRQDVLDRGEDPVSPAPGAPLDFLARLEILRRSAAESLPPAPRRVQHPDFVVLMSIVSHQGFNPVTDFRDAERPSLHLGKARWHPPGTGRGAASATGPRCSPATRTRRYRRRIRSKLGGRGSGTAGEGEPRFGPPWHRSSTAAAMAPNVLPHPTTSRSPSCAPATEAGGMSCAMPSIFRARSSTICWWFAPS